MEHVRCNNTRYIGAVCGVPAIENGKYFFRCANIINVINFHRSFDRNYVTFALSAYVRLFVVV